MPTGTHTPFQYEAGGACWGWMMMVAVVTMVVMNVMVGVVVVAVMLVVHDDDAWWYSWPNLHGEPPARLSPGQGTSPV